MDTMPPDKSFSSFSTTKSYKWYKCVTAFYEDLLDFGLDLDLCVIKLTLKHCVTQ